MDFLKNAYPWTIVVHCSDEIHLTPGVFGYPERQDSLQESHHERPGKRLYFHLLYHLLGGRFLQSLSMCWRNTWQKALPISRINGKVRQFSSGINPVTGADTYLSAGCDIQDAGSYTSRWCDLLFHVEWSFLFHGPLKMASHCDLACQVPENRPIFDARQTISGISQKHAWKSYEIMKY